MRGQTTIDGRYNVTLTITGPNYNSPKREETTEEHTAQIEFSYSDDDYGNGYYMGIVSKLEAFTHGCYDIRYDLNFDRSNKISYITQFYANRFNGKNGSWKLVDIRVREVNN